MGKPAYNCTANFTFIFTESFTKRGSPAHPLPKYSVNVLIVHVQVHVKPESVDAFREASLANARESIREPGIARFDVLQQADDSTRFILVEAYRTPEAPAAHKQTAHYAAWRDAVENMMAEPRSSVKYTNQYPADEGF